MQKKWHRDGSACLHDSDFVSYSSDVTSKSRPVEDKVKFRIK